MPIRRRNGRCCSPSPIGRPIPTRPLQLAATCRAFSAAPFPLATTRPPNCRRPWLASARELARQLLVEAAPRRFRPDPWFVSPAATVSPLFRWELAKMKTRNITRARLGTALAAVAIALGTVGAAVPAYAQGHAARPSETLNLSQGTGTLVRLSEPMSDVFVANDAIADVQVRSASQLYVFGKSQGETTVYATTKA